MTRSFRVELDVSGRQEVSISDHGYRLWLKWNESQSDDDWETFTDWVQDEIAEQMIFYIEDAEPIG